MAEFLLKQLDSQHLEVSSAGLECGGLHPFTVEVMQEIGHSLEEKAQRKVSDLNPADYDLVITLCDRAKAECPEFPSAEVIHWRFEDPLKTTDRDKQKRLFQLIRDQIAVRLRLFALVHSRSETIGVDAYRETSRAAAR
jgi:arsenate reductase